MARNLLENIFESKNTLNDSYPRYRGVKTFDLQRKHLLYGRIDKQGDAIYLDDSNLKQIVGSGGETHLAIDFVAAAFSDMRKNIRSAANKGVISKDSLYASDLRVHKSWTGGDLENRYDAYLNNLYTTFVDSYLSIDRRADKIKNFKDFTREFVKFMLRSAHLFPLTRTGFLTSAHCSTFVSGLMVEVNSETHGLEQENRIYEYIKDRNFTFFVNEVKKFGFMVDKNAPWRIVFNVASGMEDKNNNEELKGAQLYMDRFATSFDNVFQTYYRKAYLDEHVNLRNKLYSLYNSFYIQFNTYQEIEYATGQSDRCENVKIVQERKDREIPGTPAFESESEEQEYWLKIILKLRLAETSRTHTSQELASYVKEAVKRSRLFEYEAGLNYINELTKAHTVTNFLTKGRYWYGLSEQEYRQRKEEAMKIANNPSLVDYSITGTKNIK